MILTDLQNKLQAGFKNLKTQTGILSYLILVRLSPGLRAPNSSISCDASEQWAKWMLDARIDILHQKYLNPKAWLFLYRTLVLIYHMTANNLMFLLSDFWFWAIASDLLVTVLIEETIFRNPLIALPLLPSHWLYFLLQLNHMHLFWF